MQWPDDNGPDSNWATGVEFDVMAGVPTKAGDTFEDWGTYPRSESNSDLCTMRVNPSESHGWFVATKPAAAVAGADAAGGGSLSFSYVWERDVFPWMMTWEENHARKQGPWLGRTLCRGLEIGSCASYLIALELSLSPNESRHGRLIGADLESVRAMPVQMPWRKDDAGMSRRGSCSTHRASSGSTPTRQKAQTSLSR